MATFNSQGQVIQERQFSAYELTKREKLGKLIYPRDRHKISKLDDEDFQMWIYSMNPLQALNLSATRKFSWMMARRNKWWRKLLRKYF